MGVGKLEMTDVRIISTGLAFQQVCIVYIHIANHIKLDILNSMVYCLSVVH